MTHKTPLYDWHQSNGGRLVDFAGWSLPVFYPPGIIQEHLACRKHGGLFDITHMGRFLISGEDALEFLNKTLTANASRLYTGLAQYTLISDEKGRPLDDTYLFKFKESEYLLVVNGANREKDWEWLNQHKTGRVEMLDITFKLAMVALQGPLAEEILQKVVTGNMPAPGRNRLSICSFAGEEVLVSRTGYTGEPLGFELFISWEKCLEFWQAMLDAGSDQGVMAVGLGARDTLRLETCLPLYGHELAADRPIMSYPQARFGVNLGEAKGDYIGRDALAKQKKDLDSGESGELPRFIYAIQTTQKGMIREGSPVFIDDREVGQITSGTMVPAWEFEGDIPSDESFNRGIGMAYLDRGLQAGQEVLITYRKRTIKGRIVTSFVEQTGVYLRAKKF
jgi:aminomethyltransferase